MADIPSSALNSTTWPGSRSGNALDSVPPPSHRRAHHRQKTRPLAAAAHAVVDHQEHAPGDMKQNGHPHIAIHGLDVKAPRQHGGEDGLQRQLQRWAHAAAAL